ncbi:hypothetical protein [Sphingobium sp. Sx8-8]|uniref:hypothetical protein n=1 Tax=Sphingobium sp. Sx8-8 TaxID=2933617 RepID=UPI001F576F22|nr:hypothetical protein [Sphingobium sp. Sx8-8]
MVAIEVGAAAAYDCQDCVCHGRVFGLIEYDRKLTALNSRRSVLWVVAEPFARFHLRQRERTGKKRQATERSDEGNASAADDPSKG